MYKNRGKGVIKENPHLRNSKEIPKNISKGKTVLIFTSFKGIKRAALNKKRIMRDYLNPSNKKKEV